MYSVTTRKAGVDVLYLFVRSKVYALVQCSVAVYLFCKQWSLVYSKQSNERRKFATTIRTHGTNQFYICIKQKRAYAVLSNVASSDTCSSGECEWISMYF